MSVFSVVLPCQSTPDCDQRSALTVGSGGYGADPIQGYYFRFVGRWRVRHKGQEEQRLIVHDLSLATRTAKEEKAQWP